MSEQNIETVKKAYECFGRGDINGVLDLMTDDIKWITPEVSGADFYGSKQGKAGALEFFQGLGSSETPEIFEQNDFLAKDDKVVVLGRWVATVISTGKRWKSKLVHVFTLRDGKVSQFEEFFDNAGAARAFQHSASA